MINLESNDLYDLKKALEIENLSIHDYEEICKRLNRKPNRTELGMFGVMWSEHCCYRNSKPLLSKFPTKGKMFWMVLEKMLVLLMLEIIRNLFLKLKELAVSQRQAHDDLVNTDFLI